MAGAIHMPTTWYGGQLALQGSQVRCIHAAWKPWMWVVTPLIWQIFEMQDDEPTCLLIPSNLAHCGYLPVPGSDEMGG